MDSGSVLKLPTWVRVLKIDVNKNVLVREIRFDYKESKVRKFHTLQSGMPIIDCDIKQRLGKLSIKKVKKGDIVCSGGREVNPSSFFKPTFSRFSNHSEMDF